MASSSRQSAASGQSFVGSHSFSQGQRTQIEEADSVHSKLKGRLAALRQGASPGKDNATSAGYDPNDRNNITALLRKIKNSSKQSDRLHGDIQIAKSSIKERAKRPLLGIDGQDEEARKRASSRVVNFIAGSPENVRIFFTGLGLQVTPAMDDTLRRVLRELPVSNNVPITQGSNASKELASAQQKLEEHRILLVGANKNSLKFESAWRSASEKNDELTQKILDQSLKLHKAERDVQYIRDQCRDARDDVRCRDTSLQESSLKIKDLEEQVRALRGDLQRRGDDISQMDRNYSVLQRELKESKDCTSTAETELQRLRLELDNSRNSHVAEVERLKCQNRVVEKEADRLKRELIETETSLEETRQKLDDAQLKHSEDVGRLSSTTEEVGKVKEDHRKLKASARELREELDEKGRKVLELEEASRQKDSIIAQRDETIDSQVQKASTFLRHLSIDVESNAWKLVAENVLVDSACTSTTSADWLPWVIFPSWSSDDSLTIREDTRSPEAVALVVLAVLDAKLADTKDLLTLFHRLQASMGESKSMVSSITQLLIRVFTDSVGDSRLHLMHRVAMCQILYVLAQADEALHFTQALDAVDPRVRRLVNALRAYHLDSSVLSMTEALSYPGVALVGFNREPRGVIAVSPHDNGICWVEASHITITFKTIKMQSDVGNLIELPLDNVQRLSWAMTHV
ncbi:hypothetical protein BFJ70_g2487 [Fusarium oxysporum]|nr:hypothetical protein BFJ70_g2487 [Fusarium oxysporum]